MTDARLIDEQFVAYQPSLSRAVGGSISRAVIVQAIWFARDRQTGLTRMTYAELAERTGASERTIRRHVRALEEMGVVTSRRASKFDATTVWSVDLSAVDRVESDKMTGSNQPECPAPHREVADSMRPTCPPLDAANMTGSTVFKNEEVSPPSPPPSCDVTSRPAENISHDSVTADVPLPPVWVQQAMSEEAWRVAYGRAQNVSIDGVLDEMKVWCEEHKKRPSGSLLIRFITNAEARWAEANRTVPGDEDHVAALARMFSRQAREENK